MLWLLRGCLKSLVGGRPLGIIAATPESLRDALLTGRRLSAGITAPAEGLYMTCVYYPRGEGVPAFLAEPPWEERSTRHG